MSDPESIQFYIMLSAYRLSLIYNSFASISAAVIPSSSSDYEFYVWVTSLISGTKVADPRLMPNLDVLGEA